MKTQTTRLVVAGAVALLSMALPSCKKGCWECVKGSSKNYHCRDDYPNQKTFDAAINSDQAWGYKCKKQ